jgi:hypothetical protein
MEAEKRELERTVAETERERSRMRSRDEAMVRVAGRFPFLARHFEHVMQRPDGGSEFPKTETVDGEKKQWRCFYLLQSYAGEAAWQYLVLFLGYPNWRTIQR